MGLRHLVQDKFRFFFCVCVNVGLCKRDRSDKTIYQTHPRVCCDLGMVLLNSVLPQKRKPQASLLPPPVAAAKGRDHGLRQK